MMKIIEDRWMYIALHLYEILVQPWIYTSTLPRCTIPAVPSFLYWFSIACCCKVCEYIYDLTSACS